MCVPTSEKSWTPRPTHTHTHALLFFTHRVASKQNWRNVESTNAKETHIRTQQGKKKLPKEEKTKKVRYADDDSYLLKNHYSVYESFAYDENTTFFHIFGWHTRDKALQMVKTTATWSYITSSTTFYVCAWRIFCVRNSYITWSFGYIEW